MSGEEDRVVEDLGLVAPLLASLGGYQARLVWDRAANTVGTVGARRDRYGTV